MKNKGHILQKTYNDYLDLIKEINLDFISHRLGAKYEENKIKVKLFNNEYIVSAEKISDSSGQKPSHSICVILSKYVLLCPESLPNDNDWVSFRNYKNSAPLVDYFNKEVEEAVSRHYSKKIINLRKASEALGGFPPSLNAKYDFVVQFNALPMIPIILLFNDSDEDFPAKCSFLFESQAEKYLDCECLAMLGRQLFCHLKRH